MSYKDYYDTLVKRLLSLSKTYYQERLISFVLFGSVARNTFRPDSDIDFLLVIKDLPRGRVKRIREFERQIEDKIECFLKELANKGIYPSLSPVLKTPQEVLSGSWLFLDMVEDAKILYDKDVFFTTYLSQLRQRLKQMGAKRIILGNAWYWILNPDPKAIIEL